MEQFSQHQIVKIDEEIKAEKEENLQVEPCIVDLTNNDEKNEEPGSEKIAEEMPQKKIDDSEKKCDLNDSKNFN